MATKGLKACLCLILAFGMIVPAWANVNPGVAAPAFKNIEAQPKVIAQENIIDTVETASEHSLGDVLMALFLLIVCPPIGLLLLWAMSP